jgi:long-chain acyl-CoA synthetase
MSANAPSLVEIAEDRFRRFATRPLFGERSGGAWTWTTYAELGVMVDELRAGLASLGVGAGDRVAIVSRNSVAWAVAAYATYGLGATFVPMYEAQRPGDWEFILQDCAATVVIARTPEIAATLEAMRPQLPALRHVICVDDAAEAAPSLASLRARGRRAPVATVHAEPDAVAGFVYTSGTTGKPKGVMLTHGNLASNVAASTSQFPITPDDRTVSFLPWAHVYGQTVELHILIAAGASTALNDDVTRLLDDLREVKPTILVAVPRIFNRIHAAVRAQIAEKSRIIRAVFTAGLAAAAQARRGVAIGIGQRVMRWLAEHLIFRKIRRRFGGRLKYVISGSATLSSEVGQFIDALGLEVYEGYGLTETSPIVTMNRPGARKLGSVGRVLPGVTVRIDDVAGSTGTGEIVVYGPNVMKGYFARPEENARAFTADGGLRTGDLGRFDADGYLFVTGRIKEQYKLENGKYVMPTPLEEQLALSPYIANVMLHGQDRPYNVALVALDRERVAVWAGEHGLPTDGDLAQLPAVRDLIDGELQQRSSAFREYEKPRGFVLTSEALTIENGMLTPTLKLKRRNVLARHGAALEALYGGILSPRAGSQVPKESSHVQSDHV